MKRSHTSPEEKETPDKPITRRGRGDPAPEADISRPIHGAGEELSEALDDLRFAPQRDQMPPSRATLLQPSSSSSLVDPHPSEVKQVKRGGGERKCGNCRLAGHNKKKCPFPKTEATKLQEAKKSVPKTAEDFDRHSEYIFVVFDTETSDLDYARLVSVAAKLYTKQLKPLLADMSKCAACQQLAGRCGFQVGAESFKTLVYTPTPIDPVASQVSGLF